MNFTQIAIVIFSIFSGVRAVKSEFFSKNSNLRIGVWNATSKLDLMRVCNSENDQLDILIVDGLKVVPIKKRKVQSLSLKMIPMGAGNNRPFPHYHRYKNEMRKGAVYADFLDASELGKGLEACRRRNIKVMIQVTLGKDLKEFKLRKSILLASLLWNSFFAEGYFHDRPFGPDFSFDGIHFVHDSKLLNPISSIMKRLKEMAENDGERELILGNECGDKTIAIGYSDFIITSAELASTMRVPFFVANTVKGLEEIKKNQYFKGTSKKLDKKNTTVVKQDAENTSGPGWMCAAVCVGILVTLTVTFIFVRLYLKKKFAKEDLKNQRGFVE